MLLKLYKSIVFLLMLLIFMGSAGWLYSAHFCKMQAACEELSSGDCCASGDEVCGEAQGQQKESVPSKGFSAQSACCVTVNLYYNFPLYRSLNYELPIKFSCECSSVSVFNQPLRSGLLFADLFFPEYPPGKVFKPCTDLQVALRTFRI